MLDGALRNLGWWKVSLLMAGVLELDVKKTLGDFVVKILYFG